MNKEKIKAGDFFTLYHLDSDNKADYPNTCCWPIKSIAKAITVNTEQRYIGCNIIYPPRNLYKEAFHTLIDLGGWRWRYDFDFLFGGENGIRRSSSNEIFRYVSEFSIYAQDLEF